MLFSFTLQYNFMTDFSLVSITGTATFRKRNTDVDMSSVTNQITAKEVILSVFSLNTCSVKILDDM